MKSTSVIITRPREQAGAFAQRVAALGLRATVFPLLEIEPLPEYGELDRALQHLKDYALVAFVSPNAIDAACARIGVWPKEVDIAVMGAGSRRALAAHGIDDATTRIISPRNKLRTDSETLLEELDFDALRGRQVLIVRGESGRDLLSESLRAQGVTVHQVAAYRRVAPPFDTARQLTLCTLMQQENDWVITSSEALRNLRSWIDRLSLDDVVAKLQQQHLLISHVRIAETAHSLGFESFTLTASGDEALLVALQSRL